MTKVKDIKIISISQDCWRVELNGNDQLVELAGTDTLTLVKGVMGDITKAYKES